MIEVAGILTDPTFQRMRHMAMELRDNFSSSVSIIVRSLVEADYEPYLIERGLRQSFPHHEVRSPIAFAPSQSLSERDTYIGDTDAFLDFCAQKYELADTSMVSPRHDVHMASAAWDDYQTRSNNIFCFLKFTVDGQPVVSGEDDRVVLELYREVCPKAAENFASLCEASPGYTGLPVHRIVEGGWIQSGDVQNSGRGDGKGGCVVNGGEETFEDESFSISHDRAGILVRPSWPSSVTHT